MKQTEWEKIPEESAEHWLEVKDPDGWYSAIVKWDGCIHYTRYSNEPMSEDADNQDYLHICNIQSEIDRLYSLLQIAREHYKDHHYYKESFEKEPETIAKAETDARREAIEEFYGGNTAYEFLGEQVHIFMPARIKEVHLEQNGEKYKFTLTNQK